VLRKPARTPANLTSSTPIARRTGFMGIRETPGATIVRRIKERSSTKSGYRRSCLGSELPQVAAFTFAAIRPRRLSLPGQNCEMSGMDFRKIQYFVAVAEEQHFSRAAQRIGIEQSPLSRAIRSLERDLGVVLLHRSAGGSFMTPAGEIFLLYARSMIEAADCARRAVRAAAPAGSGMPTPRG
jgi:hypothetical protein